MLENVDDVNLSKFWCLAGLDLIFDIIGVLIDDILECLSLQMSMDFIWIEWKNGKNDVSENQP